MDVYSFPEHGYGDTYMIQGADGNQQVTSPFLDQFGAMYAEGAPEYVVDQSFYYPSATNYGYLCTGLESPGDWDDHHRVFGVDGQEVQFVGGQTESWPYVYYGPSSDYSQSPYNPYNPYIPGAMIGADGSFVGAQQYYAVPAYENGSSSPAYFPMFVQSGPEVMSNGTTGLFMDTSYKTEAPVSKRHLSSASSNFTISSGRSASSRPIPFTKVSEGYKAKSGPNKVPNGGVASGSFASSGSTPVLQGRSGQAVDNLSTAKTSSNRNQLKVSLPSANGFSSLVSTDNGRTITDTARPKMYLSRTENGVKSIDAVPEQNRGPRTTKSKNQLVVKAYTTRVGNCDAQGNITIYSDHYNKDDFPIYYANAKFFVIKSYSEDDVHKSIKYNVWSSTPNGNKKLNSAYEEAQKIAAGKPNGCPIFLFFSVNASGQYCGVAEMTGRVDFRRDMDFWQQDKWSGSFPVKWHIIKDLPNPNFRHVILENNEFKPVTSSRDTQEIPYKRGLEMLRICKNYSSKTSILDDFMYYENRQKMMQEEKSRLLIRSYGTPIFVPVFEPSRKFNSLMDFPGSGDKKITKQTNFSSSYANAVESGKQAALDAAIIKPVTADGEVKELANGTLDDARKTSLPSISSKQAALNAAVTKPVTTDAEVKGVAVTKPVTTDAEVKGVAVTKPVTTDAEVKVVAVTKPVTTDAEVKGVAVTKHVTTDAEVKEAANGVVDDVLKISSLSLSSKQDEQNPSNNIANASATAPTVADTGPVDVVTVGSMPIRVNGFAEPKPAVVLNVGTIPLDPKTLEEEEAKISKNSTKARSHK